jgi:1-acyl-sn-glycerol-3-phosphate acyltransferase
MPKPLAPFFPPRPSAPTLWLLERIAPVILRRIWQIERIEIAAEDRERLRALRGTRALFAANHPSLAEPLVLFQVLRREGVSFFGLTAWDTMVRYGRLSAVVFQRVGGYSVRRGRRDRAAMAMTEELLVKGERVLVFPEGQTYGLNDVLLPFQEGVAFMGFRALEALSKAGTDVPVLLVPVAVKYLRTGPAQEQIEASLRRLEAALELPAGHGAPYARLRQIATALVERLEREQGLEPVRDLNARIDALRESIAARIASLLGIDVPREREFPALVQALANAYEDFLEKEPAEEADSSEQVDRVRELYRLWLRLKNFVAVRDDYVAEWPSEERFLDVLTRLEIDVLGRCRIRASRRAIVRVGEPIDLRDYSSLYHEKRRDALDALTERLEADVRFLLQELIRRTRPRPELGDGRDRAPA